MTQSKSINTFLQLNLILALKRPTTSRVEWHLVLPVFIGWAKFFKKTENFRGLNSPESDRDAFSNRKLRECNEIESSFYLDILVFTVIGPRFKKNIIFKSFRNYTGIQIPNKTCIQMVSTSLAVEYLVCMLWSEYQTLKYSYHVKTWYSVWC